MRLKVYRACKAKGITVSIRDSDNTYEAGLEAPEGHSFTFAHESICSDYKCNYSGKDQFWLSVLREVENLEVTKCTNKCEWWNEDGDICEIVEGVTSNG